MREPRVVARRMVAFVAVLQALLAAWLVPASPAVAADGPVPLEVGWATRISSRPLDAVSALHEVALPDGARLVLLPIRGPIGIDQFGVRLEAGPAPDQDALVVLRLAADGRPEWVTTAISGYLSNTAEQAAMVRTADGRVRVLTTGQGTVHTTPPIAFPGGTAVAEVDPATGVILRGGRLVAGAPGTLSAAAIGDDLLVTGQFLGQAWLGLGSPVTVLSTAAAGNARFGGNQYVARFDPDLHVRWADQVGPSGSTIGQAGPIDVAAGSDGTTHLLGWAERTVALSDGSTVTVPWQEIREYWLRFGPDGTPLGSTVFGPGVDLRHVAPGGSPGAVVVQGRASLPVTIATGPGAGALPGAGGASGSWLGGFTAAGTPRWALQIVGSEPTSLLPLVADGDGTLTAAAVPAGGSFGGVAVPASTSVVVRVSDDGVPTVLGTVRAGYPTAVGRNADGSVTVSGNATSTVRFGDRTGAPVLDGGTYTYLAGGPVPAPGTGMLRGVVTPMGDASVTVMTGPPTFRTVRTVATAPDGSWSVSGLPAGGYRVRAVAPGRSAGTWFPAAADLAEAAVVDVPDGGTATADIDVSTVSVGTLRISAAAGGGYGSNVTAQLFTPSGGFVAAGAVRKHEGSGQYYADLVVPAGIPFQMRIVDPVTGATSWYGSPDGTRAAATPVVSIAGSVTPIALVL